MLRRIGMLVALLAFTVFTVASGGHVLTMDRLEATDHHMLPLGHVVENDAGDCCADKHSGARQHVACIQACLGLSGVPAVWSSFHAVPRQVPTFETLIELLPPGRSPDLMDRPPKALLL